VSSNAEGARLASLDPAGRHRQRRARQRVRPARGGPGDPGRPHNRTRFAIVAHPRSTRAQGVGPRLHQPVVSVPNRPGAVHDLLVPLKTTACR
jgi:chorismate mutase/prephenate dehydratase